MERMDWGEKKGKKGLRDHSRRNTVPGRNKGMETE